jgi:plasmid maintenance system antidote protein VapI
MPKTVKTPATVLQSLIEEYQTNPFALSKNTHLAYQTVTNILRGKGKIRVPIAIKLGKYFGVAPEYFINIQVEAIKNDLAKNKAFSKQLASIQKAKKPSGKKTTNTKGKTKTLAAKRKKAAKVPGARGAKRKRAKK